jgi:hypothetical protein
LREIDGGEATQQSNHLDEAIVSDFISNELQVSMASARPHHLADLNRNSISKLGVGKINCFY